MKLESSQSDIVKNRESGERYLNRKQQSKLFSLLLPWFPNSEVLPEHWWHRLVKVIAICWFVIIILLGLLSDYSKYSSYVMDNTVEKIINRKTGETKTIKLSDSYNYFPTENIQSHYIIALSNVRRVITYPNFIPDLLFPLIGISLAFWAVGSFTINLIYRLSLYIFLDDKWKKVDNLERVRK